MLAAIKAVRKLGVKVVLKKKVLQNFMETELMVSIIKKNLTLNAENSGTLGRLILGLLMNTPSPIKIVGDKSLSKRDFKRVFRPFK